MIAAVDPFTGIAAIVTALALLVTATGTVLNGRKIKRMDQKVTTVNGRSLGILAELMEARRIRDDIVPEKRTVREQSYVNLLEQVEREGSEHEKIEDISLLQQGRRGEGPNP